MCIVRRKVEMVVAVKNLEVMCDSSLTNIYDEAVPTLIPHYLKKRSKNEESDNIRL